MPPFSEANPFSDRSCLFPQQRGGAQEEIDQFRKIIQDERSNDLLVQAQLSLQEDADIIFINSAD